MKSKCIAVLAGALIAFGAQAQLKPSPRSQLGQPPQSTQSPTFSESELKAFVSAAAEIQRINAEFEERVKGAMNEQEQRDLVLAASIQQNAAVAGRGLTADRYQEIIQRIDTDPEFAERITAQLKAQSR